MPARSAPPSEWRPFQLGDGKSPASPGAPATGALPDGSPAVGVAAGRNGSDGDAGVAGRSQAGTAGGPAGAEDGTAGDAASAVAALASGQDGARIGGVPAPRGGSVDTANGGSKDGGAKESPANTPKPGGRPDSGTRRKSVVFEEDDELDVPDFLK